MKKVKTDPAQNLSRFFEIFCGEYLQIIIDKEIETVEQSETHSKQTKIPVAINGYLTDEDDQFLYIGYMPDSINQAIRKEYIIHVEVSEEQTIMDELIASGEVPDESEFN